jgi:ligand-binding sensor domain-containing protein
VIAGAYEGGVYISKNEGEIWTTYANDVTYETIRAITVSRNNYIFAATEWNGIYRSTDNCVTWNQVNNGLTDLYVRSFVVNESGDIFAGTFAGGIFRSGNEGDMWQSKNNGLPGNNIHALAINDKGNLFASIFMHGVYKSEDNGESWISSNEGLMRPINSFAINSLGYIFGSTLYGGVFYSTDNGGNWSQINSGLSVLDVSNLVVNNNDQVFAGTHVSGIFRSMNSTALGMKSNDLHVPSEYKFLKNYPNPFNATTNISFRLPEPSKISINIYNINGQLIKKLFQGKKSTGDHIITWDASNLPSATYFIRFKTKDFMKVQKCILLK